MSILQSIYHYGYQKGVGSLKEFPNHVIYWPTLSGTYDMLWRAPVDIEPCIEGGGGREKEWQGGREGGKTDQVWNIYSIVVEE